MLFQIGSLEGMIDSLEKERDFYFSKLRQIEVLCQDADESGGIKDSKVLEILYATEVREADSEDHFTLLFYVV